MCQRLGPCGVPYQTLSTDKARGTRVAAPRPHAWWDRWGWGVGLFAPDAGVKAGPCTTRLYRDRAKLRTAQHLYNTFQCGKASQGHLLLLTDGGRRDKKGSVTRTHPGGSGQTSSRTSSILTVTDSVSATVKCTLVQTAGCGNFSYPWSRPAGKREAHSSHQDSEISV